MDTRPQPTPSTHETSPAVPPGQGQGEQGGKVADPDPAFNNRVTEARRDELQALANSGEIVASRGAARELGSRAISRAQEAPHGSHINIRRPTTPDRPVLH